VLGLNATSITQAGATNLKDLVPANELKLALEVYNTSLVQVFWVGLGTACVSVVAGLGCGWLAVNGNRTQEETTS
jgi:hypothetical protein